MAPTRSSSTSRKATPKYFEEYGLRIPVVKRGQKVPHARLTSELARKSKEDLSAVVKDYAASKAPKLIRDLTSKTAIAEWIESVETLALSPHPESNLPSTKKGDLIETLGLKTTAPKAKGNKVDKDAPRKKPGQDKAALPTKDMVIAQSIVSFSPKAISPKLKAASVQQATPPPSSPHQQPPTLVASQTQSSVNIATESAEVTQMAIKRRYDSAAATTEVEQTPKKKTKTVEASSPIVTEPPHMTIAVVPQAPVIQPEASATNSCLEQASQDRETSPDTSNLPDQATEVRTHDTTPQELTVEPKNKKDPSMVIHQPTQDIIVTHAPLTTYVHTNDFASGQKKWWDLETLDGGRTYATKTDKMVYFTFIPHGYDGDACQKHAAKETPFLKPGVHGRNGDFASDPDLLTGRGHQVEPSDLKRKREYEAKYREFYRMWPYYPYVDREKRFLASEHVERREELDELERWMVGYREKYEGENVGHLWDCGCVMVGDGEESEEE